MNKDVIYIDTEDDITAIIGKVKASKERIVALVPPKRIGVLQSAVNLRLLESMSAKSGKRLVLVTNNKALINLSAVAKIPVAKSLQSKPEMAEIDVLELDDGEDIIDGEQLPVGELIRTADEKIEIHSISKPKESVSDVIDEIDVEKDAPTVLSKTVSDKVELSGKKNKIKVPNFTRFRKILFASIFGVICLTVFMVWAIIFAPAADVVISTKTSTQSLGFVVKLDKENDPKTTTVKSTAKELTQDVSITFEATGVKNTGNKATGIVTFSNCDSSDIITIYAGTKISLGGKNYITQADATVSAAKFVSANCSIAGVSSEIAVTAEGPGVAYNTGQNSEFSVEDYGNTMTALSVNGIGGGTDKLSDVVTDEDITKATEALKKLSTDSVKQQLVGQFKDGEFVINESYSVKYGDFVSSPKVGEEVTDKATLKSSTVFSIVAIAKEDLKTALEAELNKKITNSQNKIYDDGLDKVALSRYLSSDKGVTVEVTTSGKIGPNIDENKVKELIKGKKFGDAQSALLNISGVSDIKINFSYFWVTTMPSSVEKIDVNFVLND